MSASIELIKQERKRMWLRKLLLRRETHGDSVGRLTELTIKDEMECKRFTRMTPDKFCYKKRSPKIQSEDIITRTAIPVNI